MSDSNETILLPYTFQKVKRGGGSVTACGCFAAPRPDFCKYEFCSPAKKSQADGDVSAVFKNPPMWLNLEKFCKKEWTKIPPQRCKRLISINNYPICFSQIYNVYGISFTVSTNSVNASKIQSMLQTIRTARLLLLELEFLQLSFNAIWRLKV
ncbi:hypothetical protein XENOCAPTIV_025709 [Xenoophorus captivus]|uniref:Uncharacterized protein n=1 Tax=Xenoophorus captivus TaxID=1517983 RepID=A0ABV0SJV2_9TELE